MPLENGSIIEKLTSEPTQAKGTEELTHNIENGF